MQKHIFVTGFYGFGNAGDEAILAAMVSHLRALVPDLRITATSATPDETAAALGIDSILWSNTLAMAETIRIADLVIIGGGGLFHDYWGFNPNAFLTDNHWGIAFYTAPAVLAILYSKPVMLYAVGVGPLLSEHGKRFTRVACSAAQAITVRDAASKTLLESIGVPGERVDLLADPVFGFPVPELPAKAASETINIGIAVRPWDVGVHPAFWEAELASALDLLLENPAYRVKFIPFQKLARQEDDIIVAKRIHSKLRHQDRATLVERSVEPAQVLAEIATCDVLIGMRLHSLIFAMLANVPAVALSYDPKVQHVMERTGLAQLSIDIKALEAADVVRRVNETIARGSEIRTAISAEIANLRTLAQRNAQVAIDVLMRGEHAATLPSDALPLLTRAMEAQLKDTSTYRTESQRLLKEVEFYVAQHQKNTDRIQDLETEAGVAEAQRDTALGQLKQSELERATITAELARLQQELDESAKQLRDTVNDKRDAWAKIGALSEQARQLQAQLDEAEHHLDGLAQQVSDASGHAETREAMLARVRVTLDAGEDLRQKTIRSLDRYNDVFQQNLVAYRNQKAWQIMLLIRKAYTLLFRQGLGGFLSWVASWPFKGFGDLAPYDLEFPKVWNYMPERLEIPLLTNGNGVAPAAAASERPNAKPQPVKALFPAQKYDVIVLAIFEFDFRFQRPQQIAAEFARRGHRVFWISPGRVLESSDSRPYEAVALRENMWEIHLRAEKPEIYTGSQTPEQAAAVVTSLAGLYADFAVAESCALLQFPFWRQVGLELRERFDSRVVYDCMDDWQNWTAEPRISEFNLAEERKLVQEANALVVTSQEFLERHEAMHPVLARNAADFDFFSSPRENELIRDHSKPIVGYYGAIADWFNLEWVTRLAQDRPGYNFVLIGQVHGIDPSKLAALPNVSLLGEKNYREIPLYLSHFDVALIPFVLNKLTKGVDPVKLYEYFSQGKPVVATDMAELAQATDPELLYISKTYEDFVANVDRAIQEKDATLKQRRISYAKANTWAARVDAIESAVEKKFSKASILVVTYNSADFIEPCFEAIQQNTAWPDYEVIVVDNNSTDATPELLKRFAASDARFKLELLGRNSGFAGGNNIAAKKATGEYLVFLNADTIVTPGWLGRLIQHSQRDERIGAIAAVTNFSGNETKVNVEYAHALEMRDFALKLAKEKAGKVMDIAVAALYCVLVPRRVWDEIGELDEGFQVGMFEDDDFSLRVRNAGHRVVSAEDTFIHHFGNGSFAKIPSEESVRIFEQNRKRFEEKWNTTWKKHAMRPGARSPYDEPRPMPAEFLTVVPEQERRQSRKPAVKKLHPSICTTGKGFNTQPDGTSALVVECENATPGTVVMWDSTMLATSYGSSALLSAIVPAELCAAPATVQVRLLNDFGQSDAAEFVVESSRRSAAAD